VLTALTTRHNLCELFIRSLEQTEVLTASEERDDCCLLTICRAEMKSRSL